MVLYIPLCIVEIIFAGIKAAFYYSLCFSFTSIDQVLSKYLSFSRLGGQISKVESGVLAVSKGCSLHFFPPVNSLWCKNMIPHRRPGFQKCNVIIAIKLYCNSTLITFLPAFDSNLYSGLRA